MGDIEDRARAEIERRSRAMAESMRTSKWGKPAQPPGASKLEAGGEAASPPTVCSWSDCDATATRVVCYRPVRHLAPFVQRAPYCGDHIGPALAIYAPTWQLVAWAEDI